MDRPAVSIVRIIRLSTRIWSTAAGTFASLPLQKFDWLSLISRPKRTMTLSTCVPRTFPSFFQKLSNHLLTQVYDGRYTDSPVLLETSGKVAPLLTVVSTSNEILVRFTSNHDVAHTGFLAIYSSIWFKVHSKSLYRILIYFISCYASIITNWFQ